MEEVKFGGGLLGHLDKGGTFDAKQEPITKGYWEMTGLDGKGCHTTQNSNRASNGGDCSRCRSCYRRCRAAGLAGGA
jgi:hypothetical protein